MNTDPTVLACELAVFRACEVAVRRTRASRPRSENRALFPDPPADWYLTAPDLIKDPDAALLGAWDQLRRVLADDPDQSEIVRAVHVYTRHLIVTRTRHDRDRLAEKLRAARHVPV
ncbi:hypothetical protein TPB0596_12380 [Tsukamurella pulmonis]|uniref:hypothetical protein n=1 Tax=Tsukamurella pulmonis TaxID=47312 RepID=UPI001EDE0D15|nr:hypothetical protein [Tsukamurella pulmonis]BDD81475.1 hypothetical protein TPB0596_12380 [Tsukamurella pulmonis]